MINTKLTVHLIPNGGLNEDEETGWLYWVDEDGVKHYE